MTQAITLKLKIMKLLKSNYDNKAVINHLRSSLSIMESTNEISFTDNSFLECDITVFYKDGNYELIIKDKGLDANNLVVRQSKSVAFNFTNRTDTIKKILQELKIIN